MIFERKIALALQMLGTDRYLLLWEDSQRWLGPDAAKNEKNNRH